MDRNSVIRHKEILLPAHKDIFPLRKVFEAKVRTLGLLSQWTPGREASPMLHVDFLIRAPFWVSCLKSVFSTNDLAFKVCSKSGMFVGKA